MSAIRLPLLCAFAGGCLSNAVLFGLWRAADGASAFSAKQQHRSHEVVELVTAATAAPSVEQSSVLPAPNAVPHDRDTPAEPAPSPAATDVDSAAPMPSGSAVSDVLMGLEAAYRERVAARAPLPVSSTPELAVAAAPAEAPSAAPEPARVAPPQPAPEAMPAAPTVVAAAAIEPRAVAPAAMQPATAAPVALAPEAAPMPAFAGPSSAPPSVVHYGDVNQNTYITNVRQGDVYLIQMQQLAMLQYMQLLGMSSGVAAPARHVGGAAARPTQFPSGITNPDNPWGFHFAPPNLVR